MQSVIDGHGAGVGSPGSIYDLKSTRQHGQFEILPSPSVTINVNGVGGVQIGDNSCQHISKVSIFYFTDELRKMSPQCLCMCICLFRGYTSILLILTFIQIYTNFNFSLKVLVSIHLAVMAQCCFWLVVILIVSL